MTTIRRGTPRDVPRALEIWRSAVDSTHGFLTAHDRAEIDEMVATEFLPNSELWLVEDDSEMVTGFLVMDGNMIDALFVDPAFHAGGSAPPSSIMRFGFNLTRSWTPANKPPTRCRFT